MIEIDSIIDVEKYISDINVVIFDLDDTLYSEKEYVRSGYKAIGRMLPEIPSVEQELWNAFINKQPAIDVVLNKYGLKEKKEEVLHEYRFHKPDIHLYPGVKDMLDRIRKNKKIGIISDGRPEGQRSKIEALGLCRIIDKIIITDELGGIEFRKPNYASFVIMREYFKCDFSRMVYVGDNINKDFIAPNKLKMRTIWFDNKDGLYSPERKVYI